MKLAVTGGSGNIGRRVCRELAEAGHEVWSVDRVPPGNSNVGFREADLTALEETRNALRGADQVIHLAAIPNPYLDPAERVMSVNMAISYSVFEAARRLGIARVIYGCSESATGFGIHEPALRPEYVPIDEEHPVWPHETYSLSKYFGEVIGEKYSVAFGMQVLSLRYTWVIYESCLNRARELAAAYGRHEVPEEPWFGAYISVGDVARAIRAAVEYDAGDGPLFEAFMLTAPQTMYNLPTLDVLKRIYGDLPPVSDPSVYATDPYASVFDLRKAKQVLGWEPKDSLANIDEWDV
jgi:nucleoside-diphosphate-sugar epimerase